LFEISDGKKLLQVVLQSSAASAKAPEGFPFEGSSCSLAFEEFAGGPVTMFTGGPAGEDRWFRKKLW